VVVERVQTAKNVREPSKFGGAENSNRDLVELELPNEDANETFALNAEVVTLIR